MQKLSKLLLEIEKLPTYYGYHGPDPVLNPLIISFWCQLVHRPDPLNDPPHNIFILMPTRS